MADGKVTKDGKEPMETGFVLSEIGTMTPHPARKYDTLPACRDVTQAQAPITASVQGFPGRHRPAPHTTR
jgi:hypothetical protein